MTVESLRKALGSKPFVPFTLHLASGATARVPSPEFVMINPEAPRSVAIAEDGGFRIIDLLLVEEIRYEDAKPRKRAG
ncbi:MAG: hypothetical protein SFZ23_11810 [Planctomycetota bacterium]|nr:hypothetical protein [Planctomycetota bacterium]